MATVLASAVVGGAAALWPWVEHRLPEPVPVTLGGLVPASDDLSGWLLRRAELDGEREVLVRHPDDPQPLIAEGSWHGEIIDTPRGENGFGYDPYFFLPEFGKTGAELDPDHKNTISHRGQALDLLVKKLRTS